jgi:toxoflavin biosynthesis protein ToxD
MERTLWVRPRRVKNAGLFAGITLAWLGVWALAGGCGAAPPKVERVDPYAERIANCILVPRGKNDAAQEQMAVFPAGMAVLGSTEAERAQARLDYGDGGRSLFNNEFLARRAHVPAFKLDRVPVTHELYREFVEACGVSPANASSLSSAAWAELRKRFGIPYSYEKAQTFFWNDQDVPEGRAKHPVVLVTHDEASLYCAWRGARLPTEDEWERAARGQEGRTYPWGPGYDQFRVNNATRGVGSTVEVAALPQGATPDGIYDLGGNVYEWTSTPWPGSKDGVVVKGNGWDGRGGYGRGAARLSWSADLRNVNLGFRCAATVN